MAEEKQITAYHEAAYPFAALAEAPIQEQMPEKSASKKNRNVVLKSTYEWYIEITE